MKNQNLYMKYLSLIIVLISNTIFAQKNFVLEGKIGNIPATMLLFQGKNVENELNFTGTYYYHSQEIPIEFYEVSPQNNNQLELTAWIPSEEFEETFTGTFDEKTYKGNWIKGDKKLTFEFKVINSSNYIQFQHHEFEKVVPISSKKIKDPVQGVYRLDWFLPTDKNLENAIGKRFLEKFTSFEDYKNRTFSNFEKEYKEEITTFLGETDMEVYSALLNYEFSEYIFPLIETPKYLVMGQSYYSYTGGAHGFSQMIYHTYNKSTNKWVELKDVLDLNQNAKILSVLDQTVREKHKMPATGKLNEFDDSIFLVDEVTLTENFTISKNGITFHYGLYELTPYAYGYYDLFVPYSKLKPYLNKSFQY